MTRTALNGVAEEAESQRRGAERFRAACEVVAEQLAANIVDADRAGSWSSVAGRLRLANLARGHADHGVERAAAMDLALEIGLLVASLDVRTSRT